MAATDALAFGDDLTFRLLHRNGGVGGSWVIGLLTGHRFQALVFPEHAENSEYELGLSRISKLWLQRVADGVVVFNFDRGLDRPARDAQAQSVVDFLAAELARRIFA